MSSSRSIGREEEERRRLAGELHDQVGQGLTALLLQLKTVIADAPEPLRAGLLDAQAIARENLDEVRRIARRLRPSVLDDLGLPYALLALADAAEEQADLLVVRRVDASTPRVSDSAELVLYRIAQEALTNTLRHANASSMSSCSRRARIASECNSRSTTTGVACSLQRRSSEEGLEGCVRGRSPLMRDCRSPLVRAAAPA